MLKINKNSLLQSKMISNYIPKIDKYTSLRGGNFVLLNIFCSKCKTYLLSYQKDGPGPLKRLCLNRIFNPKNLRNLQNKKINELMNLTCNNCERLIAIPSIYKEEGRKIFLLFSFAFIKKIIK